MQFYVTNDHDRDIDDLARVYDDRAGIEPLIARLKSQFGAAILIPARLSRSGGRWLLRRAPRTMLNCA